MPPPAIGPRLAADIISVVRGAACCAANRYHLPQHEKATSSMAGGLPGSKSHALENLFPLPRMLQPYPRFDDRHSSHL
jgi:hypothetical protein